MQTNVRSLAEISRIILADWNNPSYYALPYIKAMQSHSFASRGLAKDNDLINGFLCNASAWRGDTARIIKAELKRRLK